MKKTSLVIAACAASVSVAPAAVIIPSSGITVTSTAGPDGNSANFDVSNVLDGLTVEGWRNAASGVNDYDPASPAGAFPGLGIDRPANHQNNHYITEDGTQTATLTFDLGAAYDLVQIDILNTSNTAWNDRETETFTIAHSTDGGSTYSAATPGTLQNYVDGFQAVPYSALGVTHVQIAIANNSGVGTEPGELNPGALASSNDAAVGLNEVQFCEVPEPSSTVLLALALGLAGRRRRA